MTVTYVILGKQDAWWVVKCFYEDGPTYGEFYLHIDPKVGLIEFAPKEGNYALALTRAFSQAMQM